MLAKCQKHFPNSQSNVLDVIHGNCVYRYTGCGFGGPSDEGAEKTKDCLGWKEGAEENACGKTEVNMTTFLCPFEFYRHLTE